MSLYDALDPFLAPGTWYTGHPLDEQRFYKALAVIARDPKFDPQDMMDYIEAKKGTHYKDYISDLKVKAEIVRDYLAAI